MEVFIARHAIFDRSLSLFGYELLFRSCCPDRADVVDDTASTLQVLATSLLASGLDVIRSEVPAFINFGKDLLISEWTSLFPPQNVVIEILESVDADESVKAACLELKTLGYRLALDDVVDPHCELADFASFVKIDFRLTTREQQVALANAFRKQGKRLIAEKVETHEEFEWALKAGYDYFQGFFFARPILLKGHQIPSVKVNALRLLQESQKPELDFVRLENIIKCDISLNYKLFRYVNSALFARSKPISAIRQALVCLGEMDIRRWVVLATLPTLGAGAVRELIAHALVRARFCELLASAAKLANPSDAFLVGMFSLLDAFVQRPLPEILGEMSLSDSITGPLLRCADTGPVDLVYQAALRYEAGSWDAVTPLADSLGVAKAPVADLYVSAVEWSNKTLDLLGVRPHHTLAQTQFRRKDDTRTHARRTIQN